MTTTELPPWEGPKDDWSKAPLTMPTWTPRAEALKERERRGKYQRPVPTVPIPGRLFDKRDYQCVEEFKFSRVWSMPSADTFSVPPVGVMVMRYLRASKVSCDPFARNNRWATHSNDLNPATKADHHMDAEDFLRMLADQGVRCDLAILDPPYSPRQISECYKAAGVTCGMRETQNAALYSRVKSALVGVLTEDAIVLSFGWNSSGMGIKHGFEQIEIMLVCHGGAHNDTICVAERRSL